MVGGSSHLEAFLEPFDEEVAGQAYEDQAASSAHQAFLEQVIYHEAAAVVAAVEAASSFWAHYSFEVVVKHVEVDSDSTVGAVRRVFWTVLRTE